MMFLVIFGSLALAMAVVAQGNLRTAESARRVSRAMSAAETGLVFAARRLQIEGSRFVIEKGVVDTDFAQNLWMGTYDTSADGDVDVLEPDGYTVSTPATGLVYALQDAHLADEHDMIVETGDSSLPAVDEQYGTLRARPIALESAEDSPYFRLKYELLSNAPMVRVTSQGVDGDITRTLQMDFRLTKRIKYAVISPNRIMIGKNVRVEGPLGSRYGLIDGELATANGDPLVMRSDFYWLDNALSADLNTFFEKLLEYDVDGDGRLRPDHPTEKLGLAFSSTLIDYDGNEYVDDFDLFMAHYDGDDDRKLVYDGLLTAEVGYGVLGVEFDDDMQLARLIDEANPDRDGDGEITIADRQLGYRDGIIDDRDMYAKVTGELMFAVARDPWDTANGQSYQSVVQGPVLAGIDDAPAAFEVDDEILREIDTVMFLDTQTWFDEHTSGSDPFGDTTNGQVASAIADGGTYTAPSDDTWESVPFGAIGAYDFYQRGVYQDMTFTDVRIPKGVNALFVNCTFVGVTYIETQEDCDHENWNYAGSLQPIDTDDDPDTIEFEEKFPGFDAETGGTAVVDTRVESNNIRFHDCTFLGSLAGDTPSEYTHWRNKIQMTGNTRFYIEVDDEDLADQDDAEDLVELIETMSDDTITELKKSSIMLPGWSVDVGNFTNEVADDPEDTPKVKLKGTIIAGILDVRGTADVHGTVMMTFRPTALAGPLFYGGLTDAFNTTIGYFGPEDGDSEGVNTGEAAFDGFGEITLRYDPDALLPDGIPWPVTVEPQPLTYIEGGSM